MSTHTTARTTGVKRTVSGLVAVAALGVGALAGAGSAHAATDNDKIAWDFFRAKGLTAVQTAGIIGNYNQESGSPMNPAISQIGGGPGRGIAQWSAGGGRWDASTASVTWYAASKGLNRWSLQAQLEFTWWELNHSSMWGLSQLKAQTSISGATSTFMTYYERCGTCAVSNRLAYANNAYAKYNGGVVPGETSFPTLSQGSTNQAAVKTLQYLLRSKGYTALVVDGSFGPATLSAVKSFQSKTGLSVDGVVGPNTWKAVTTTLSSGATGDAVRALQVELKASGATLTVTATFDSSTLAAVKSYQTKNGLSADGIVGDLTWGSLID